ncbi:hypothetical protein [Rhodopseudomonas palustris]|uniref:hypothetical protein n=1 Tax=Rhodopseudomonas palustris TaxID=1076 RepID=UPI0021F2831D|nr:hypothetical protein [Rhodopseudomonas palustris]UYO52502.1 hypothetical protein KQX61_18165 [Rhodopseudomonas palustris]
MWLLTLATKLFSSTILERVVGYLEKRSNDAAVMHGQNTTAATQIVVATLQAEIEARKVQSEFTSRHDKIVAWIAAAFILHIWMLVLDHCFHLGWNVGPLPDPLGDWEGRIILSFFIVVPTASVAKALIAKVWK